MVMGVLIRSPFSQFGIHGLKSKHEQTHVFKIFNYSNISLSTYPYLVVSIEFISSQCLYERINMHSYILPKLKILPFVKG
jgi:hypothetical protein